MTDISKAPETWEVSEKLVSSYEADFKFTLKDMVEMFKKYTTEPKYRLIGEDKAGKKFQIHVSDKGTDLNSQVPSYKTTFHVDHKLHNDDIIAALTTCRHEWDHTIEATEKLQKHGKDFETWY
jgi:hypothetical protein